MTRRDERSRSRTRSLRKDNDRRDRKSRSRSRSSRRRKRDDERKTRRRRERSSRSASSRSSARRGRRDRDRDRDRERDKKKRVKERSRSSSGGSHGGRSRSRRLTRGGRFDQKEVRKEDAATQQALALRVEDTRAVIPQVPMMGLKPPQVNPDVEAFLGHNPVEPHAAARLRALPLEYQQMVLARGSLLGARDPTAVVLGRIRAATQGALQYSRDCMMWSPAMMQAMQAQGLTLQQVQGMTPQQVQAMTMQTGVHPPPGQPPVAAPQTAPQAMPAPPAAAAQPADSAGRSTVKREEPPPPPPRQPSDDEIEDSLKKLRGGPGKEAAAAGPGPAANAGAADGGLGPGAKKSAWWISDWRRARPPVGEEALDENATEAQADKMDDGNVELRLLLARVGLSEYLPKFLEGGFGSMNAVRTMDEADLRDRCGMSEEHVQLLKQELAQSDGNVMPVVEGHVPQLPRIMMPMPETKPFEVFEDARSQVHTFTPALGEPMQGSEAVVHSDLAAMSAEAEAPEPPVLQPAAAQEEAAVPGARFILQPQGASSDMPAVRPKASQASQAAQLQAAAAAAEAAAAAHARRGAELEEGWLSAMRQRQQETDGASEEVEAAAPFQQDFTADFAAPCAPAPGEQPPMPMHFPVLAKSAVRARLLKAGGVDAAGAELAAAGGSGQKMLWGPAQPAAAGAPPPDAAAGSRPAFQVGLAGLRPVGIAAGPGPPMQAMESFGAAGQPPVELMGAGPPFLARATGPQQLEAAVGPEAPAQRPAQVKFSVADMLSMSGLKGSQAASAAAAGQQPAPEAKSKATFLAKAAAASASTQPEDAGQQMLGDEAVAEPLLEMPPGLGLPALQPMMQPDMQPLLPDPMQPMMQMPMQALSPLQPGMQPGMLAGQPMLPQALPPGFPPGAFPGLAPMDPSLEQQLQAQQEAASQQTYQFWVQQQLNAQMALFENERTLATGRPSDTLREANRVVGPKKPSTQARLPGDWNCPSCGDHQFARNRTCRSCGSMRPADTY